MADRLAIRAVQITGSRISGVPVLPDRPFPFPEFREAGSVTLDGDTAIRKAVTEAAGQVCSGKRKLGYHPVWEAEPLRATPFGASPGRGARSTRG